jgi:hypothetical protein
MVKNSDEKANSIESQINSLKKSHNPSYARGLVRLAKSHLLNEESLRIILVEASNISDPYYGAFALSSCAREMQKSNISGYSQVFNKAMDLVMKVSPDWRKAEILELVISRMGQTGISNYHNALEIYNTFSSNDHRINLGKKIIREMVRNNSPQYNSMLSLCKTNKERLDIIKFTANEMQRFNFDFFDDLENNIKELDEPLFRLRAWAYLGLKAELMGLANKNKYFEYALSEVALLESDFEKLEGLKLIIDNLLLYHHQDINRIINIGLDFIDKTNTARLLSHIAGAEIKNYPESGLEYFNKALGILEELEISSDNINVVLSLVKGLQKAGSDEAENVLIRIKELLVALPEYQQAHFREKIDNSFSQSDEKVEKNQPIEPNKTESTKTTISQSKDKEDTVNPVLGLYNTYDKKLGSAHLRAIARAAPLCWAYDLDLAIFNFPIKNKKELINLVIKDTSVGKGGVYLEKLYKNKRIKIYGSVKDKKTDNIIATTSHPYPEKKITTQEISHLNGELCFLIGVGKIGLPKNILDHSKHHLEFTGVGVSLETCSAMGVLAHILHSFLRE